MVGFHLIEASAVGNNDSMNDTEIETIAVRLQERIVVAVQTAERLRAVEVQTQRIATDLESEKASHARGMEKVDAKLEALAQSIQSLSKSNWTAAGAIGAALVLWDVLKHFVKF